MLACLIAARVDDVGGDGNGWNRLASVWAVCWVDGFFFSLLIFLFPWCMRQSVDQIVDDG